MSNGRRSMRLVVLAFIALLGGCEDIAYALRPESELVRTLKQGQVDIARVEF